MTLQTAEEWRLVFLIASGVYLFGLVIYWFWASGESIVQSLASISIDLNLNMSSFQVKFNHGHRTHPCPMKPINQNLQTLHMLAMLTKASKWANNHFSITFWINRISFMENKNHRCHRTVVQIEVPN